MTAHASMHFDHVFEDGDAEPIRMGIVTSDPGGHDEAEGDMREKTNLAIAGGSFP